jgi:hypothetical protein
MIPRILRFPTPYIAKTSSPNNSTPNANSNKPIALLNNHWRTLPESQNISPIRRAGAWQSKGGQNHIFGAPAPHCDLSVFEYILLPAPLDYACSVKLLKKVILTIPRIRWRKRRAEKNYFAPPAEPPTPPIARHRYVVRHMSGHPPAKLGRGAGPGSARKKGSKFGDPPKKLPHFSGDREKKGTIG